MKAITIKQPWASLIVAGIKDIENRTWKTSFRGRVLIHAAKTPVKEGLMALNNLQLFALMNRANWEQEFSNVPNGAIIGSVEIVDCVKDHSSRWAEKGVWNWVLANPIMFNEPIMDVKGKLSFWDYPYGEETKTAKESSVKLLNGKSVWDNYFVRQPTAEDTLNCLKKLPKDKALRLAYVPVIITKIAFTYIDKVISQCVKRKLPYSKPIREIKEHIRHYNEDLLGGVSKHSLNQLDELIKSFLDKYYLDMTSLWWSINQEIRRRYPEIEKEQSEFITAVYMPISLLKYMMSVGYSLDRMLKETMPGQTGSIVPMDVKEIQKRLEGMVTNYKLEPTPMQEQAIKTIGKRIDAIELGVID